MGLINEFDIKKRVDHGEIGKLVVNLRTIAEEEVVQTPISTGAGRSGGY